MVSVNPSISQFLPDVANDSSFMCSHPQTVDKQNRIRHIQCGINSAVTHQLVNQLEVNPFGLRKGQRQRFCFTRLKGEYTTTVAASSKLGEGKCERINESSRHQSAVDTGPKAHAMNGVCTRGGCLIEHNLGIPMHLPQHERIRSPA